MKAVIILSSLLSLAAAGPIKARQANLQTFTGAIGGIEATPILDTGDENRPFSVNGATFDNIGSALQRSCDQQFNACANAANGGDETVNVSDCAAQKDQCSAGAQAGNDNAGNQDLNQDQNQNQNQNQTGGNAAVCTRKSKRRTQKKA